MPAQVGLEVPHLTHGQANRAQQAMLVLLGQLGLLGLVLHQVMLEAQLLRVGQGRLAPLVIQGPPGLQAMQVLAQRREAREVPRQLTGLALLERQVMLETQEHRAMLVLLGRLVTQARQAEAQY